MWLYILSVYLWGIDFSYRNEVDNHMIINIMFTPFCLCLSSIATKEKKMQVLYFTPTINGHYIHKQFVFLLVAGP